MENLRYERKYLVPNDLMPKLRDRLMPFVEPDKNTLPSRNSLMQYTVRSIYFDSRNFDFYQEKSAGVLFRRKFRIRGYNSYEPGKTVVFEIKRKIEDRIKKHRSQFKFEDVKEVLQSGCIEDYILNPEQSQEREDDARRFMFHVKKDFLHPSVLIVYEREAWHGKFNPDVRITFDKNIRSIKYPDIEMLFEDGNYSYLFNRHFVLEIKYFSEPMPMWGRSLVKEFDLRHQAISKYTIGFDVSTKRKMITY